MALIGLKLPVVGILTETGATTSYSQGMTLAKAIKADITINSYDAQLYAEDSVSETDKSFKDGTLSLGVDDLDMNARAYLLGKEINEGELISSADDIAPYVGVGFYAKRVKNKVASYRAIFIKKVQFSEPSETLDTKGENISFQTPTITGNIMLAADGRYKEEKIFSTEEEAAAYIKGKVEHAEQVATPSISPEAGTHATTQSVTITTSTPGATIYYTIDGTTPSPVNGTLYSEAISVATRTVIRAIATKSGLTDSAIANSEFVITA